MKVLIALLLAALASAQTVQAPQTSLELVARMAQLMESTAVAVPDLIRASEPLRKQTEATIASMKETQRNPAFGLRFIDEAQAYLALSDAYLVPGVPAVAEQQFAELRDDLSRFRQRFETDLAARSDAAVAEGADPNNLHRYAEADTKLPPLGTLPRVVFLGDSITDGWHLNEYFSGHDFVNRGIGGQTTIQMLGRFLQDVAALHPKAVVILGGTNDLARGMTPQAIEDTLNMMGDLAKSRGIKAIFASVLPVSAEVAKVRPAASIQQINRWLQDYCRREGFVYLDYYSALADSAGQLPGDLSGDGLHPNAKGYSVMSRVALEAINRALETAPAPTVPARKRLALPIGK
jgi:lysophospholipase L1-like esterase